MGRAGLAILLLASSALAQVQTGTLIRHLKLRLRFTNGVCDPSAEVQLIGTGGPMPNHRPDDQCEVDFGNVAPGNYRVDISGQGFTQTEEIVTTTDGITDLEVEVKGRNEGAGSTSGALISAAALSIPAKAIKEFDKSNDLINRQQYQKAIQSLNRAIAIDPNYAAAYNNLGAVYQHLGDRAKEREALQRAVNLDHHLAAAFLNLGRMDIADNNFSDAEEALSQAASSNPSDPTALVLLAYCELQDHHFDDVIANSHKAHGLQGQHSSVHLIAAKSFEQKRDAPGAILELELFLQEEPTGERAEQARKELAALHNIHP